jgi:hypothetical protein
LQVFRIIGTLKNRKQIEKRKEKMILILGLANNDPIKMMVILKKLWE